MIDRDKVFQMARTGFSKTEIAKRLGCSRKQVTRIIKQFEAEKNVKFEKNSALKDRDVEAALRRIYLAFESGGRTASRFGITRQAIFKGEV